MPEESQDTRRHSNVGSARSNATTVKRSPTTKLTSAPKHRSAEGVQKRVIDTANARRASQSVFLAGAHTNHLAGTAESSTHLSMSRTFRMIQLNVRKQGAVHDSLMNDEEIQDATVLAIQEPQARRIQGRLLTTPMGHHKWTKMVPSTWREGRWAIRSMLWINKDVEAEQVPIESPDMTAAIIRLPSRLILVVSVYVPGADSQALKDTCDNLRKVVMDTRQRCRDGRGSSVGRRL